jgi:hypothetical protein
MKENMKPIPFYRIEYNQQGSYRICMGSDVGEWAMYKHPAFLLCNHHLYVAYSEYWSAPIQPNYVYELKLEPVVPTIIELET